MTYRSILVHIDGQPDSARRIGIAARLAAELEAALFGLAIVPPLELPQALRSRTAAKAMLQQELEKSRRSAKGFAADFVKKALAAGAPSAEASVVEDQPVAALEKAARTCDLVVLGQPGADDIGALGGHFVEAAVTSVSRPVLVIPHSGEVASLGRRVLVAWKDAAASARALADARPFLERAKSVTVLTVAEDDHPMDAADATAYLTRHGAKSEVVAVKSEDAGDAILKQAKKLGADLVVMGAYARPRLAEMVLGGATRTVLQNMATPVLMSH